MVWIRRCLADKGHCNDRAWYRNIDNAAVGVLCSNALKHCEHAFDRGPACAEEAREEHERIHSIDPVAAREQMVNSSQEVLHPTDGRAA